MSDECSIDLEQVEKLGKALHKWDCSQCTYKNWPNVKHCTMCGTPKDYVSVGISSDIIGQDSYGLLCLSYIQCYSGILWCFPKHAAINLIWLPSCRFCFFM